MLFAGVKTVGIREVGLPRFARAGVVGVAVNRNKIALLSAEDIKGFSDRSTASMHGCSGNLSLFAPVVLDGLPFLNLQAPVIGGRRISVGQRATNEVQPIFEYLHRPGISGSR